MLVLREIVISLLLKINRICRQLSCRPGRFVYRFHKAVCIPDQLCSSSDDVRKPVYKRYLTLGPKPEQDTLHGTYCNPYRDLLQ